MSGLVERVMSYLHGDRYLAGAYPPEWPGSASPSAPAGEAAERDQTPTGAGGVGTGSAGIGNPG